MNDRETLTDKVAEAIHHTRRHELEHGWARYAELVQGLEHTKDGLRRPENFNPEGWGNPPEPRLCKLCRRAAEAVVAVLDRPTEEQIRDEFLELLRT